MINQDSERKLFEQWMKKRGTPLILEHEQAFEAWIYRAHKDGLVSNALKNLILAVEREENDRGEIISLNAAMHNANCALLHNE